MLKSYLSFRGAEYWSAHTGFQLLCQTVLSSIESATWLEAGLIKTAFMIIKWLKQTLEREMCLAKDWDSWSLADFVSRAWDFVSEKRQSFVWHLLSQGIANLSAWLQLTPVTDRQTNRSFLEPGLYILLCLFFRKLIHTELFFQSGLWSAPWFHGI